MMTEISNKLYGILNSVFDLYSRTLEMHWNVEGMMFPSYHKFFETLYQDVHSSIDPLAEEIRALGQYVTLDMSKSILPESKSITGNKVQDMLKELDLCNEVVIQSYTNAFELANDKKLHGLCDFLSGMIDMHTKHKWMIRSCLND